MGVIRVGRRNQKTIDLMGGISLKAAPKKRVMDEKEKAAFIEGLRQMPKDKWVSTLRAVGLDDEANECERALAEEHLHEINLKNRANRLSEIMQMPEEEQLPLLQAEGYDEEAKVLSEKLAASQESSDETEVQSEPDSEKEEEPVEEETPADEETPVDDKESSSEESSPDPVKKRGGRRKSKDIEK